MLTPIAPPNYWPLRSTSSTSVTVTPGDGTIICTNTNNATVAIPSAANLPNRIIVVKKGANNTATVTLDPNGSETIDGATTYVLYVVNDYVVIQSDGSNWQVVGGYLAPHTASVYMTTPVSCASTTFTRMPFNGAAFDVGGLADITTDNRIEIKRGGKYQITAVFRLIEPTEIQVAQCHVYKNGTTAIPSNLFQPAVFSGLYSVRVQLVGTLELAAGDYLDLYGHQINSLANSYNTLTSTEGRPTLTVTEVR